MICSICGNSTSHDSRCPYAPIRKTSHYCSICKDGIFNGEEYVENDKGDYAHFECVDFGRDLIKFLGLEIKEMDGDND